MVPEPGACYFWKDYMLYLLCPPVCPLAGRSGSFGQSILMQYSLFHLVQGSVINVKRLAADMWVLLWDHFYQAQRRGFVRNKRLGWRQGNGLARDHNRSKLESGETAVTPCSIYSRL